MGVLIHYELFKEIAASDLPSFIEGLVSLVGTVIGTFIEALIEETQEDKPLTIKNPNFEICNCGKGAPHGYFRDEDNKSFSMKIFSKSEAYMFIDELEDRNVVTSGDASSLRVMVELSKGMVESPLMN